MSPDGVSKTPSPEERLLRLIRNKGGAASAAASPAPGAASAPASPTARTPMRWGVPAWWLAGVNVLLGVVLAVEALLWILTATKPQPVVEVPVPGLVHESPEPVPPTPPDSGRDIPPLSAVAARPLFQTPAIAATPAAAANKPSQEAKDLAARLTLLGIVAGDPPQAIIEDAQTKKTFFVTVGQSVVEGLVVAEVGENRVTLDLTGEKIDLSL